MQWPAEGGYRETVARITERAAAAGMHVAFRSRAEVSRLFDGLQLVEPGLVRLAEWHPGGPREWVDPWDYLFLGGVARKP